MQLNDFPSPSELEDIILYGCNAGADFVEIFLESSDNFSVLAEQDKITSVNPSFSKGAGIRIFRGLRDGFISTNDLSISGLIFAVDQALAMLALSSSNCETKIFNGLNKLKDYGASKDSFVMDTPSINDACNHLLQGTQLLEKHGSKLQSRRGNYARSLQEVIIAASDGTFCRDIRLHQSHGLSVIASDRENRASIGRRYGSEGKTTHLSDWDIDASAQEICNSTNKMLYAEYVQAGQKPVVLANKFGGVIFHEACGHLLETTQIERGTTPFLDKIGKQIANKAVTAIDEGGIDGAFGSISIDDEGMEAEKTVLIKDGVLQNFLSDRAGSLRTGHRRTGSGRRQNYSFSAASRMRNTYISAGKYNPQELINSVENGLYCKSMGGGSVGPTGQFNFSVEEGYLIENGKLTKPVKGATLIGEAKEIMPRISMCANDLDLAAGFCGSISGSVNVTVGQPHIKVDSITIGGR
ncbi:TldD/PmbA family protein [Prochlorococcus sp. MIT 1223]|uniref:TldD/PmbA family protein n=1 Tax=Prochlorococcus sp. MIT 1223 TaxID=3096217 RepID=UPI002A74F78D|nr:TldD/PmbA family protein [Prochlorococcus sp. MIT 1223]